MVFAYFCDGNQKKLWKNPRQENIFNDFPSPSLCGDGC
jgi:hypothetical protein